jgi:uncharacterized protein YdaU (DUF1376 family)
MGENNLAMMPWFPGNFMKSTRGWSVTAKGVYRELLDAQWDMGELPTDPNDLRAAIGATAAEWAKGWAKCETKFPVGSDGQRRNLRLEEHRTRSARLAERHAKGAAKTNAQRYAERPHSDSLNGQSVSRTASQSALAERDAKRSDSVSPTSTSDSDSDSEDLRSSAVTPLRGKPPDPRKMLWDMGLSLLGNDARSVIGQAIKRVGEAKVGEILGSMAAKPPADPKPYFIKATQERGVVV